METEINKLYFAIGRSHMYWGSKPLAGVLDIFKDTKDSDLVLDPFCGGGSPTLAAILKGGRVIASDLNPMAVFLTKVLIRSVSIPALITVFEDLEAKVGESILGNYRARCPTCGKEVYIDYLVWDESEPIRAKYGCNSCKENKLKVLPYSLKKIQLIQSQKQPQYWFPDNEIKSFRKPPVKHHFELFTNRNLTALAELFNAIEQIPVDNYRDAFRYIFTSMLYSCSSMQMFSDKEPSSSRGWTAPRFYIPPQKKEKNVWNTFKTRFDNFIRCKSLLNTQCFVQVTDSKENFFSNKFNVLIFDSDAFDSIKEFGKQVQHIFLDPPYIDDVDYFAFSEFWGAWLKMDFDFYREWHPKRLKGEGLEKLLKLVNEVSRKSCTVSLAFSPKETANLNVKEYIVSNGFTIKCEGQFQYNNSNKRKNIDQPKDKYFVLEKTDNTVLIDLKHVKPTTITENSDKKKEVYPYFRIAKFLNQEAKIENIRSDTFEKFLPTRLHLVAKDIIKTTIQEETKDTYKNEKAYNSLCYTLISEILKKDNWEIAFAGASYFEDNIFGISLAKDGKEQRGAFIAKKDDRQIRFCFDYCQKNCTREPLRQIKERDGNKYKDICIMIVSDKDKMHLLRKDPNTHPRGFFVCFEEIREKCEEIFQNEYLKLCASIQKTKSNSKNVSSIDLVEAEIINNIPVGLGEKLEANHYKLKFVAAKLPKIVPGQFIMINTSPNKQLLKNRNITLDTQKKSFKYKPEAYLKRPFGIHRAYYPNFGPDYLKNISLPPILATIVHTILPNEFDILYKVLDNGVGTNEMKKLKKGDKIEILGPLGNRFDLRQLRGKEIKEVHVIGGGVGMAPLIFLVQALRFFAFEIKAFIGIESIDILKHRDDYFVENPNDVKLYVDDLKATGLKDIDIFVSCDKQESDSEKIVKEGHFNYGVVSEQYKKYLESIKNEIKPKNILAFTCGPSAMMNKIGEITDNHNIRLKVLMEKRMGCGIGVCFSCVCETTGDKGSSRVCVEGPIFDSKEIKW